jgi:hypothetical protein
MAIGQFQKGLLGYDPMELRAQEQKQWQSLYANAGSPYEKMGIALGQLGGAMFGAFDSPIDSKAKAINEALTKAGEQYQQGTSEYYKAIADSLPADYADSKEVAIQKYLETKKVETTVWSDSVKAVKDNPELVTTFQQPLAESLLQKATKKGWNEQDTPIPKTMDEIKEFAKKYELTKDSDYGRYIALQQIADKEGRKEVQQEEQRLLTMDSIRSTIAKNNRDMQKIKDDKFETGNRWNAERESALALFAANKLDPNVPLKGINLANTELVNAQRIALRQPWTGKANEVITPAGSTGGGSTTKPVQPTTNPIPLPASPKDAVIGQVYSTTYGPAQWDGKKFNPVAK